jgi:hypothetical protein
MTAPAISVTSAETAVAPVTAAAGSPLFDMRTIRAGKLAKLYKDLEVPRWDEGGHPKVMIRYRPISQTSALNSVEKRQSSKAKDWVMLANADQLVQSCVGVYVLKDDDAFTLAPDGSWVEFDPKGAGEAEFVGFSGPRAPELAAAFGINLDGEASKAVALCKGIYFTEGDMAGALQQLTMWSAKVIPAADEEALGE